MRVVGALGLVAGLVLAGLGVVDLQAAGDDRDEADAVTADAEDVREEVESAEAAQAELLAEASALRTADSRMQSAVRALRDLQRDLLPRRSPALVLDRAVDVWNAGDHGGAVAIVDAEVPPLLDDLRDRIATIEAAALRVLRRLAELEPS